MPFCVWFGGPVRLLEISSTYGGDQVKNLSNSPEELYHPALNYMEEYVVDHWVEKWGL